MATKRYRDEDHLPKEDYFRAEEEEEPVQSIFGFSKATPNTRGARTILKAQRVDRKQEFIRHIRSLNASIHKFFSQQLSTDEAVDLVSAAQDYIDYSTQLEDRYLRRYGEVLTFGSGDCGQLAHGIEDDDDLMVKFPRVVYSLREKKVLGIACGGLHNAVYTEDGHVFTWGCSDDGSLGRTGDENTPIIVSKLQDKAVIGVACGDGQTVAITTTGEVWAWGCFKDREGKKFFNLPHPKDSTAPWKEIKQQQNEPVEIEELKNIVEVACGASFCLARSSSGFVYSWGLGESGELGRKVDNLKDGEEYDKRRIYEQHLKPGFMYIDSTRSSLGSTAGSKPAQNVKAIGCGAYHSMVVVVGDVVFTCGLNQYGQLGLGHNETPQDLLVEATTLSGMGVVSVKGGVHHSLVLTSAGEVLAFGRSDSCQLGVRGLNEGEAGSCSVVPVAPDLGLASGVKVVQIACGGNHNLALTSSNDVYTWGYGDMLALGHGKEEDEPVPKKLNFTKARIESISVTQVAGGGQHSALIGEVLTAK